MKLRIKLFIFFDLFVPFGPLAKSALPHGPRDEWFAHPADLGHLTPFLRLASRRLWLCHTIHLFPALEPNEDRATSGKFI